MRYFIHLAYKGTAYRGWQKQSTTDLGIQQILESCLSKMTGKDISIMGCGRTDAGVHAMQFFAHFDLNVDWSYDPVERLNRMLPDDISVFELIPVEPRAHSRYDAIRRSYEYHIHFIKNPYLAQFSFYLSEVPDFELIRKGLDIILKMEDFRYFCLTPDRVKNTKCTIYDASIHVSEDRNSIIIRFTANRFLKSMIRIITGYLLELGSGKIDLETFEAISEGKVMLKYPVIAYPHGLHLSRVVYPYLERKVNIKF